jgi:hypothetical protein
MGGGASRRTLARLFIRLPANGAADASVSARFEENRPRLRAVTHRMLGSTREAEDAVHETWLRIPRADPGAEDNLGGWLTTGIAHVCIDRLRARKTRVNAAPTRGPRAATARRARSRCCHTRRPRRPQSRSRARSAGRATFRPRSARRRRCRSRLPRPRSDRPARARRWHAWRRVGTRVATRTPSSRSRWSRSASSKCNSSSTRRRPRGSTSCFSMGRERGRPQCPARIPREACGRLYGSDVRNGHIAFL